MKDETRFELADYTVRFTRLRTRLISILRSSGDRTIRDRSGEVPGLKSIGGDTAASVSLAFVGQYNSGKSTMISALTARRDIPIDADVCTDTVTAYDWHGIQLLDTPGIHAGYRDHDRQTYDAMDRADLLVFVVTTELFDDVIGEHFRELAFGRGKADEMVLVINKVGQDPGTAEAKRPDIERVTRPRSVEAFRTVFIDALSYIEAIEETSEDDRRELLEISGFDDFILSLNDFVAERGLMGRLTTPLFGIESVARQAKAHLDVDMPEERAALELLDRKQGLIVGSRGRLRGDLSGLVAAAASDVVGYGDEVAESIEPGRTGNSVNERHKQALRQVRERCTGLGRDACTLVEKELSDLKRQLDGLRAGSMAQKLRSRVEMRLSSTADKINDWDVAGVEWEASDGAVPSDWQSRFKKVGEVADGIGRFAVKRTTGPHVQAAIVGSATASRGSQGHQVIYQVGKFFGHSFKPWGAVKAARAIGNIGRWVAAAGVVLVVISQIAEDKKKKRETLELRDARDAVRTEYRNMARAIEEGFWSRFNKMAADYYDMEIEAIDFDRSSIVGDRDARNNTSDRLNEIELEAKRLIRDIQEAEPHAPEEGR